MYIPDHQRRRHNLEVSNHYVQAYLCKCAVPVQACPQSQSASDADNCSHYHPGTPAEYGPYDSNRPDTASLWNLGARPSIPIQALIFEDQISNVSPSLFFSCKRSHLSAFVSSSKRVLLEVPSGPSCRYLTHCRVYAMFSVISCISKAISSLLTWGNGRGMHHQPSSSIEPRGTKIVFLAE